MDRTNREVLTQAIRGNFTGNGPTVDLAIFIEEGYKEYFKTGLHNTGKASVKMKVVAMHEEGNFWEHTCSLEYFLLPGKSTPYRLEKLFQVTLRNTVYKCLVELRREKFERT